MIFNLPSATQISRIYRGFLYPEGANYFFLHVEDTVAGIVNE